MRTASVTRIFAGWAGRSRRAWTGGLVLLVAASLLAGSGCDKAKRALGGGGSQDESVVGKPLPKTHSSGKKIRMGQECKLDKTIANPAGDTPEWVLAELLSAAASPRDDEAAFDRFYKHFPETRTRREVRSLYWSKARKYVKKYLVDEEGQPLMAKKAAQAPKAVQAPTGKPQAGAGAAGATGKTNPNAAIDARFVECRREAMSQGRVKIFIKSFDANKSNPPMTFKKDDKGVWKVAFFTP